MSLAAQARSLAAAGAAMRQEIFGTNADSTPIAIDYDRGSFAFVGYYSPIKNKRQIEEAGFLDMHDCIVRVLKTAFLSPPEIGKELLIIEETGEIKLRIDELSAHVAGAEWVLGCNAVI